MNHPDEQRLYDAALERDKLTLEERQHLDDCDDCMQLIRTFARQLRTRSPADRGKLLNRGE